MGSARIGWVGIVLLCVACGPPAREVVYAPLPASQVPASPPVPSTQRRSTQLPSSTQGYAPSLIGQPERAEGPPVDGSSELFRATEPLPPPAPPTRADGYRIVRHCDWPVFLPVSAERELDVVCEGDQAWLDDQPLLARSIDELRAARERVTVVILGDVAPWLPALRSAAQRLSALGISITRATDDGLGALVDLPNLEFLHLRRPNDRIPETITERGAAAVGALGSLRALSLDNVDARLFRAIAEKVVHYRTRGVAYPWLTQLQGLEIVGARIPRSIGLCGRSRAGKPREIQGPSCAGENPLPSLRPFRALRHLALRESEFTDFRALQRSRLMSLSLPRRAPDLAEIPASVEWLELMATVLNRESLRALSGRRRLRALHLRGVQINNLHGADIPWFALSRLEAMTLSFPRMQTLRALPFPASLRYLTIRSAELPPSLLTSLPALRRLRVLGVRDPRALAPVANVTSLQELAIRVGTLDNELLQRLSSLTSLKRLRVTTYQSNALTDDGLRALSGIPLHTLILEHARVNGSGFRHLPSSLTTLTIATPTVRDPHVAQLSHLTSLRRLSLKGWRVGSAAIPTLRRLPLRLVDLRSATLKEVYAIPEDRYLRGFTAPPWSRAR